MGMLHSTSGRMDYASYGAAGSSCSACGENFSSRSASYRCNSCVDYELCSRCIDLLERDIGTGQSFHPPEHVFFRVSAAQRQKLSSSGPPAGALILGGISHCSCETTAPVANNKYFCSQCDGFFCSGCDERGRHADVHRDLHLPPPGVSLNRRSDMPPQLPLPPTPSTEECGSSTEAPVADAEPEAEIPVTLESLGISVELLKRMLRRENDLRLSEHVQEQYRIGGYDGYGQVTEAIQHQVCMEFNVSEAAGVTAMQCAESLVTNSMDMQEINDISLYRKYNRMRNGNINVDDIAPNINNPLYNLDGSQVSLQDLVYLDPSVIIDSSRDSCIGIGISGDSGGVSGDVLPNCERPYVIIAASRS